MINYTINYTRKSIVWVIIIIITQYYMRKNDLVFPDYITIRIIINYTTKSIVWVIIILITQYIWGEGLCVPNYITIRIIIKLQ